MNAYAYSTTVIVETVAQVIDISDASAIAAGTAFFAFPKDENHKEEAEENSLTKQVFEKIRHMTCKVVGSTSNSQTLWRYLDRSEVAQCS
ncbi:hypothetical protein [Marivita sp. XM-24bin2]|uniref:hypothetical protein n=1 Tax=unclassified Marivita TaxID=2632480 RepID=UPI000D7AD44D|nr:hypothetical protein [Marivita sp. XM-24bin2]MCR9107417.1 hypothetical protein [Paracoccaceae bacterium]PWL35764.1 MAG: hypothetical protein DCO97_07420 [Marivita sp. XM-24bin2]